jgi:hypothetical protein
VLRPGAPAQTSSCFDPDGFEERGTTFEPNRVADRVAHVLGERRATALRDGSSRAHEPARLRRRYSCGG